MRLCIIYFTQIGKQSCCSYNILKRNELCLLLYFHNLSINFRKILDYSKPVSYYWPEFAEHDKDNITVELLISHQV